MIGADLLPQLPPVDTAPTDRTTTATTGADGSSNNDGSNAVTPTAAQLDPSGGHHLLKHCLSDGQRCEALAHFNTDDVKEAAKEISRMGQRELQTKFKLVYGTATHSNNNDWLRRKLYEAVGAAPIKATTKTKPRKPSTPKGRVRPAEQPFQAHSFSMNQSIAERRFRRNARSTPKALALAEAMKRQRNGPHGPSALPSSPVVGRSVLDLHRFLAHNNDTTTSDDSDAWMGEEEEPPATAEEHRHYGHRQRVSSSEPESAAVGGAAGGVQNSWWQQREQSGTAPINVPTAAGVGLSQLPAVPPHMRHRNINDLNNNIGDANAAGFMTTLPQRAPSLGFSSLPLELTSATSLGAATWNLDAWADAELNRRQSSGLHSGNMTGSDSNHNHNNNNTTTNSGGMYMLSNDDEDLLIPMDLSAFDSSAGCSLL